MRLTVTLLMQSSRKELAFPPVSDLYHVYAVFTDMLRTKIINVDNPKTTMQSRELSLSFKATCLSGKLQLPGPVCYKLVPNAKVHRLRCAKAWDTWLQSLVSREFPSQNLELDLVHHAKHKSDSLYGLASYASLISGQDKKEVHELWLEVCLKK